MGSLNGHPHVGKLIRKKIENEGISQAELGRRIHLSRQNVFDILKRETLDTGTLRRISIALNYDFLKLLSPFD